jgi:hypothetical protein
VIQSNGQYMHVALHLDSQHWAQICDESNFIITYDCKSPEKRV